MKLTGKSTIAGLLMLVFAAISAHSLQPASPELVNELTNKLSITPKQATAGAGTLFQVAKSQLSAADFGKIAAVVPGMSSFLKAAPSTSGGSGLSGLTSALPGSAGTLASAATAFQKLGLSPSMVEQFLPILTNYLQAKGGSGVASLFSKVVK